VSENGHCADDVKQSDDPHADNGEQIPLDETGEVTLPLVDVLRGRGAIFGKAGSGKSNSASVVLEELLDREHGAVIVDTDGEYWGLKEQYEVLHVGADEECEFRVAPEHAEKLAELALEQNVPIVLDVSGYLDEDERNAVVRETARALFEREKRVQRPFPLLVEEVHEYIPEGGALNETGEVLIRVAKRGRKRGLGIIGISQRPADVKKDFITQCDWLLWHRLTWDNDTKVVRRVVGSDYAGDVQDLDDGQGFLMADFLESDVLAVRVRRKRTYDAGAAPGLDETETPDLKSIDADLVDDLKDISEREERRQDRIAQLEAEIDEREDSIEKLEQKLENQEDIASAAQQMAEALSSADNGGGPTPEVIEEKNARIADLEAENDELRATVDDLRQEINGLRSELDQRPEIGERAVEAVEVLAGEFGVADGDNDALRRKLKGARKRIEELEEEQAAPSPDVLDHPQVERFISRMQSELRDLDNKERQMLKWFKYNGPGSVGDAYWAAGGARDSRRRYEKLKTLRNKDFVEQVQQGEYRYQLRDTVADYFDSNDEVTGEYVDAILAEIETELEVDDAE
jgi:predicted  nucleic acid-binding Zn-ribbon protein